MEVHIVQKLYYPAIFHKAEEGGFWVSFPDFPECLSEGDDMKQTYEMASDALSLAVSDRIKNKEKLPDPCQLNKIDTENEYLINVEL